MFLCLTRVCPCPVIFTFSADPFFQNQELQFSQDAFEADKRN